MILVEALLWVAAPLQAFLPLIAIFGVFKLALRPKLTGQRSIRDHVRYKLKTDADIILRRYEVFWVSIEWDRALLSNRVYCRSRIQQRQFITILEFEARNAIIISRDFKMGSKDACYKLRQEFWVPFEFDRKVPRAAIWILSRVPRHRGVWGPKAIHIESYLSNWTVGPNWFRVSKRK